MYLNYISKHFLRSKLSETITFDVFKCDELNSNDQKIKGETITFDVFK